MMVGRSVAFILALCVVGSVVAKPEKLYADLVNADVTRSIDLSSHIARIKLDYTLENRGSESVSRFYIALPKELESKVAWISFEDDSKVALQVVPVEMEGHSGAVFYRARTNRNLAPKEKLHVSGHIALTHAMTPFPSQISQNEPQLVQYIDNLYFYTPYQTIQQKTNVRLASTRIEKATEKGRNNVRGDTLQYGPFEKIAPFTSEELFFHFENNKPFLTATKVLREIEISHWGNVAVEEHYELMHSGAVLKGSFSRLDYQRQADSARNAIRGFTARFPKISWGLYYRDDIGNISTSHARREKDATVMQIEPRFPLMGGWKTAWYQGYNVPTRQLLKFDPERPSTFVLNTTFGVPFEGFVVDDLTVKVILPEGASDIKARVPFGLDAESTEVRYTYLDTFGRPVLVFSKKNVVDEHDLNFQVVYTFGRMAMLREPFLLIGGFFLFFLLSMAYVRFELTISSDADIQRKKKYERLVFFVKHIRNMHERLEEEHSSLSSALDLYEKQKVRSIYDDAKKAYDASTTSLLDDMQQDATSLEGLDAEAAKKANAMVQGERKLKAFVSDLHKARLDFMKKEITKAELDKRMRMIEASYQQTSEQIELQLNELAM